MSLYVGHLSSHVQREDLERAFGRFGRCNIKLKDGYGFVVYSVRENAERALLALRGKIVCGEQISLSWSNKQPGPFQKNFRSTKVYEPPLKRFKEDYDRVGGSQEQRDFQIGTSNIGTPNHKRNHSDDNSFQREAGNSGDYIHDPGEGKCPSSKVALMNEGASTEHDPSENGRWGEPLGDALTGYYLGNSIDFDRYEPYSGLDGSEEKDKNKFDSSFGSPDHGSLQEKWQREQFADRHLVKPKSQFACYNCGLVGHKAQNCTQGDRKRERTSNFSHRRVEINSWDRGVGRVKRFRSNSWGRTYKGKNPLIPTRHGRDREDFRTIKVRQGSRSKCPLGSKETLKHKLRVEFQNPKDMKQKHDSSRKMQKKGKARRSESLSSSSDSSTASPRSNSQSVRSASEASRSSRSKSKSYGSANSRSRSASKSSPSRSVSSNSKSKSSFHSFPSLSVSLDQISALPGKGEPVDVSGSASPNNKSENVLSPDNMRPSHSNMGKPDPGGTILTSKDEIALDLVKLDSNFEGFPVGNNGVAAQYSATSCEQEEHKSSTEPHKDGADSSSKFSDTAFEMNNVLGSSAWKLNGALAINSSRVTSQDLIMALRHYGLVAPDETEMSSLSIDRYFGAARLWPWEIIYFRRMKKGPISTENYAKRLQQNREFGIVDRYIRSSSGWGECDQMMPEKTL